MQAYFCANWGSSPYLFSTKYHNNSIGIQNIASQKIFC